jgi:S-adenosylmethionine:tRNA ribosyltransferase-isomerase
LRRGDLLVVNDTRVTALRLTGRKESGGQIEVLLMHEPVEGEFIALCRPAKRLKLGDRLLFAESTEAVVIDLGESGVRRLKFSGPSWRGALNQLGQTPLPPYITESLGDPERYQTVYAESGGSAAAPTAGLHFTEGLLSELIQFGIRIAKVSLDVSLDTFRPISSDSLEGHVMHGETCRIPEETAQAIAECEGRIIAVGTTTVRTLESLAVGRHRVEAGETMTRIFIRPGYEFRVVDAMFTNFHLPKTTMLAMLAAFCGRIQLMDAYQAAVTERYRFLSFGDSMLVL